MPTSVERQAVVVLAAIAVAGALAIGAGNAPSSAPTGAGPASATTQPAARSASRTSGKWSCWTQPFMYPRCVSPQAIWFAPYSTAHIWRYDRKTEKVQAFSVLDGLPLEEHVSRVTAAADERCAILTGRSQWDSRARVSLWHPKEGWRALPALADGGTVLDIGFDAKGRLLALSTLAQKYAVQEFADGSWRHLHDAPQADYIIMLPEGYMLGCIGDKSIFTFVPAADPTKPKTFTVPRGHPSSYHPTYFLAGGKTFALLFRGLVHEIGPNGLRQCPRSQYLGWDMKAGGILSYHVAGKTDKHMLMRANVTGVPEMEVPHEYLDYFRTFRDVEGHVWWGSRRWDGRKWENIDFGKLFPEVYCHWAHARDRLQLTDDGRSWSVVDPGIPMWATGYNKAKHTAWVRSPYNRNEDKGRLQLIRQNGQEREVIRTVPYENYLGMPEIQSPDGDWWWCGGSKLRREGIWRVVRLTPSGIREYPMESRRLYLSAKGTVWSIPLVKNINKYYRYNPKSDTFVEDAPWEDFAFMLGKLRLSYVPPKHRIYGSTVYRKTEEGWKPFLTPYSPHPVKAAANAVFRDLLLVTVYRLGVMEYNSTLNKWVRLTDNHMHFASFDCAGRRILTHDRVLVYEGDPWSQLKSSAKEQAAFLRLLTQMDDDSWPVRDKATRTMARNLAGFHSLIVAAVDDHSLSLEVWIRLKSILPSGSDFLPAPPGLFRTMHPLLVPSK